MARETWIAIVLVTGVVVRIELATAVLAERPGSGSRSSISYDDPEIFPL